MSRRCDFRSRFRSSPIDQLTLYNSGSYPDNGAFSEYLRMATDLAWRIPDNISFEQAATVTVGLYSAVMCMSHPKRLNMVEWPDKVSDEQWVSNVTYYSPLSSVLSAPPFREPSDIWGTGSHSFVFSFFVAVDLQRVDGRWALRRSIGSFIWIQSGDHRFAGESRDAQKSRG